MSSIIVTIADRSVLLRYLQLYRRTGSVTFVWPSVLSGPIWVACGVAGDLGKNQEKSRILSVRELRPLRCGYRVSVGAEITLIAHLGVRRADITLRLRWSRIHLLLE